MKKIMVLLAVMTVFAVSCVTFTTQPTAVEVSRPGISYKAVGLKNVPSALSSATVDYTNGVAPAIASELKRNPKATVIVTSKSTTYIGDNGQSGKQTGVVENHAEYSVWVKITLQEGDEKFSSEVLPHGYKIIKLLPGAYHIEVLGPDWATILGDADFNVDAISADNFSDYAKEWVDFTRVYNPAK